MSDSNWLHKDGNTSLKMISGEHFHLQDSWSFFKLSLECEPADIQAIETGFVNILQETSAHFLHEEGIMVESDYAHYAPHKQDHDLILGNLMEIIDQLRRGEKAAGVALGELVEAWMQDHSNGFDADLVNHLAIKY